LKAFFRILLILVAFNANAQLWNNIVIKTHPLRDIIVRNYNLGLEKIISKHLSVELEYTYKNTDNNFSSCNPNGFRPSKSEGYRILTGTKYFLFLSKREIPNSWYIYGQIGYKHVEFNNYNYCANTPNSVFVDDVYHEIEYNLLIGREFRIYKKLFMEINIGFGVFSQTYTRYFVDSGKTDYGDTYNSFRPYTNWTIGYLISKSKKD